MSTPRKINAILLNIQVKWTKTGKHVWKYTDNKLAKFHGNILSLSENIAKSIRRLLFLTHTVVALVI